MNATTHAIRPELLGLLDAYVSQTERRAEIGEAIEPQDYEAGRRLLELSREDQIDIVLAATSRIAEAISDESFWLQKVYQHYSTLRPLLSAILRRQLPFDEPRLIAVVEMLATNQIR